MSRGSVPAVSTSGNATCGWLWVTVRRLGLAKLSVVIALATAALASHAGSYEDFFAAIKQDDSRTLAALLQRGFDPDTPDPQGQSGLILAAREPAMKAFLVLVNWPRIKVETRNANDESPLMIAALKGYLDKARLLIDKGADVNKTGWTPLHYAATKGDPAMIDLLLESHAYIDAESPNGSTPLMMAAMYGTTSAVKLLLESGADPSLRNEQGLTAIDFAQRGQRLESVEVISAFIRAKQPRGKW